MAKEAKNAEPKFGHDRKVSLSARVFGAALLAVSTEETRFYLNGVYVSPCAAGGVTAVATNGHLLVAIHDPSGEANAGWICPVPDHMRQFMLANLEPRPSDEWRYGYRFDEAADEDDTEDENIIKPPLKRIFFDGHMVSITAPERMADADSPEEILFSAQAGAIDGTFPDWRRVLPKPNDKTLLMRAFTISGRYARDMARVAAILTNQSHAGIRLLAGGEMQSPILVGAMNDPNVMMVLMAMRDDGGTPQIPSWAQPTP